MLAPQTARHIRLALPEILFSRTVQPRCVNGTTSEYSVHPVSPAGDSRTYAWKPSWRCARPLAWPLSICTRSEPYTLTPNYGPLDCRWPSISHTACELAVITGLAPGITALPLSSLYQFFKASFPATPGPGAELGWWSSNMVQRCGIGRSGRHDHAFAENAFYFQARRLLMHRGRSAAAVPMLSEQTDRYAVGKCTQAPLIQWRQKLPTSREIGPSSVRKITNAITMGSHFGQRSTLESG